MQANIIHAADCAPRHQATKHPAGQRYDRQASRRRVWHMLILCDNESIGAYGLVI